MEAFLKSIEQLRKITGSDIKAGRILKSIGARLELNGTNDFNKQLKEVIEDIMDENEKMVKQQVVSDQSHSKASTTAPSTPETVPQEHENVAESMCSSEDDQVDKDMKKATRRVKKLLKLKETFASRLLPRDAAVSLPEDG